MINKQYAHSDFKLMKEHFELPSNKNLAASVRAKLFVQRCPNINFFCTSFTIPEFSIQSVEIGTNSYLPLQEPGEQYVQQPFNISLLVDEDFENWLELMRWFNYIIKNGSVPDSYSNAVAIILNSEMNPVISIHLFDIFPLTIGQLEFNTSESELMTLPVSFSCLEMDIEHIPEREWIFSSENDTSDTTFAKPFN